MWFPILVRRHLHIESGPNILGHHRFRKWLVACWTTNHYLNQCKYPLLMFHENQSAQEVCWSFLIVLIPVGFQTEDGWKAEVELIAQLGKRLAVVKGKGTKSKPLLQVIGVCNQDYLGPKDDIKIYHIFPFRITLPSRSATTCKCLNRTLMSLI